MFGNHFHFLMTVIQMVNDLFGMPIERLVMDMVGVETAD